MTMFPMGHVFRSKMQKARQNEAVHRAMIERQAEAFRTKWQRECSK